jgi:hypothetical protein
MSLRTAHHCRLQPTTYGPPTKHVWLFLSLVVGASWLVLLDARASESKQQNAVHPPNHSVVLPAGKATVIQFPTSYSLGALVINSVGKGYTLAVRRVQAQGKVVVPPYSQVCLVLGNRGYSHPYELSRLPPDALYRLSLKLISSDNSEDGLCDRVLACASSLTGLKSLYVALSDTTDAGLTNAAKLTNLEEIQADQVQIDGSFLKSLTKLKKLYSLAIGTNDIKCENLQYLSKFEGLRVLDLGRTQLNNAGVAYIGQCKDLESLELARNPDVTDDCIKSLANLEHLSILGLCDTGISLKGLAGLKHLPLKIISLPKTAYTLSEMDQLKKLFPSARLRTRRGDVTGVKDPEVLFAPLH